MAIVSLHSMLCWLDLPAFQSPCSCVPYNCIMIRMSSVHSSLLQNSIWMYKEITECTASICFRSGSVVLFPAMHGTHAAAPGRQCWRTGAWNCCPFQLTLYMPGLPLRKDIGEDTADTSIIIPSFFIGKNKIIPDRKTAAMFCRPSLPSGRFRCKAVNGCGHSAKNAKQPQT